MIKIKFNGTLSLWLMMGCFAVQNVVDTKGMPAEFLKIGIRLTMALERQIYYTDLHIMTMERSLMQILDQITYNTTKEDYLSTSISALPMVRRLAEDWTALAGMMRGLTSESLTSRVGNVRWPTGEDLEAATKAVVRGQIIYSLDTDLLAKGSINNMTFSADIIALDGFHIAKAHIKRHNYPEAAEWLQYSLSRIRGGDNSAPQQSVLQYLATALCYTGVSGQCKLLMVNILRKYPGIIIPQDLSDEYYNISFGNTDTLTDTANYLKNINEFGDKVEEELVETLGRLCRGESKIDTKLRCRYVHYGQSHLRFQPFKLEELQWDPPVIRFYDAITDLEAEMLRKDALKLMKPAILLDDEEMEINSDYRSSFTAWLGDAKDSEVAHRLVPRMSDMTRLDVTYAENHQVTNYALSGAYSPHEDYLQNDFQHNRIATLMYYLTDVKQGGNTVFLEWALSVTPVKNSAILWFNFRPDGNFHEDSLHSGCPVVQGRKWVLNKWILNLGGFPCTDNYTKSYKNYYIE